MSSQGLTPHGPGFRFIDRFSVVEAGKKGSAEKWLDPELAFFKDHFPGEPLMPGVLLIEAAAQSAGALWGSGGNGTDVSRLFLARVLSFSIKRAVLPNQTIRMDVELERDFGSLGQFAVTITESGEVVAQGSVVMSRALVKS